MIEETVYRDGRGADVALELVGAPPALKMAMDAVRVGGVISCQGLHTHKLEMEGLTLYNKNLRCARLLPAPLPCLSSRERR